MLLYTINIVRITFGENGMANLLLPYFYGSNYIENFEGIQGISLQLHITAECDQSCKHCYMYNSPYYQSQIENALTKDEMIALIDEYFSFLAEYDTTGLVAITGGDPLLSPYFWDLLSHIHMYYAESCEVAILGNPYHVTEESAKRMRGLGVGTYQISLDGLEETHDFLRKKGSFANSLRALKILHEAGISTVAAFTLSKLNRKELLPLYDYLASLEYVDSFGFDRMIPTGNGKKIKDEIFSPEEYRQILFDIYKYEVFRNSNLVISKKEQMWKTLFWELGLADPVDTRKKQHFLAGCECGTGNISVLADGTFFSCRKLEIPAGKYPEKSFKEIFISNDTTDMFRQYDEYKGCVTCEANVICRGCPAMKYAVTGDFYGCDPYCWRCS